MPEKILKAEDDYIALQSLGQFLTEEGYQIERASTGLEALKLLENDRFDLVISDISMPELDGFQRNLDRTCGWGTLLEKAGRLFAPSSLVRLL